MGSPNWFLDIIRTLFRCLDYVVYWLIDMVYQLFIMISEAGVFSPENISKFAGRIYALLGIFMLFKVSFSLITYILNPDSFTDKSKGIGKLLTNFFVVLIGIVAVPYVFQAAYGLQSIILKENVIGNLIMGMNTNVEEGVGSTEEKNEYYIEQGGNIMSFTTLSAFVRLNPSVVGEECANNPIVINNGKASLSGQCTSAAFGTMVNTSETVEQVLEKAYTDNNVNFFTTTDIVNLKATDQDGNEVYLFDYTMIISTIAGGFLAWILLLFCIDIATRSVKLGFLQLIAPIPIISYVDPKGQNVFKKWLGECGKTYLDLFIRLIAIYFVIFIIGELASISTYYNIAEGALETDVTFGTLLVKILLIFGALMFAKQLPDFISNITGIKFNGGFTLNPMNKLQQVPLVGSAATNILGRTAGAIEAARHDQTGNRWRAATSGWFAAGNALHGKVPLMGAKPGSSTVRSIHTGREAGFEVATGSKMKTHSRINDLFREDGKNRIKDLKDNYRAPLQQELNNLGLQKQEAANAYNKLNEQLQTATSEQEKAIIRTKMQQAQTRYQDISKQEAKISGDIGVINDQIKDLERAYSIDKSPSSKVNEVRDSVDSGSYHRNFEPVDYDIPASNPAPSSAKPTIGGVNVSSPNANGERTTDSGIILPGNIDLDK